MIVTLTKETDLTAFCLITSSLALEKFKKLYVHFPFSSDSNSVCDNETFFFWLSVFCLGKEIWDNNILIS